MIARFSIKNFRCFRVLEIHPLARINIIAGANNVGKTTLLEAIHLHCNAGAPQLPVEINQLRGIERPLRDVRDVAGWLFHHRNLADPAELTSESDDGESRSLRMGFFDHAAPDATEWVNAGQLLRTHLHPVAADPQSARIVLEYTSPTGSRHLAACAADSQGMMSVEASIPDAIPSVYAGTLSRCPVPGTSTRGDFVNHLFSEIEREDRQAEILEGLRFLEPRLSRLVLLVFNGVPVIHGHIGRLPLVPLPFLGEGTERLLTLLLAIATTRGGVVLVDELENGLHHAALVEVWKALIRSTRRADAQLFVTTHSWECIEAAHKALGPDGGEDIRLHRLERCNGDVQAVTLDRQALGAAVDMHFEVR